MPKPKSKTNEVVPLLENERRQRRKFTAEQKNRILDQADACKRGELGELLRREGIYASQLTAWRAQREQNGLAGLAGSRPGPKPSKDSKDRVIEKLGLRRALPLLQSSSSFGVSHDWRFLAHPLRVEESSSSGPCIRFL